MHVPDAEQVPDAVHERGRRADEQQRYREDDTTSTARPRSGKSGRVADPSKRSTIVTANHGSPIAAPSRPNVRRAGSIRASR